MQQYRDIFNAPVSVFRNVGQKVQHGRTTLGTFLKLGESPEFAAIIADTRDIMAKALAAWARSDRGEYDELLECYKANKWRCPFAILQGVCPDRKGAFESYSDVIVLDIDTEKPHKKPNGNEFVTDWGEMRDTIAKNPFVAYCGLSVGGRGLFCIIPIESHEHHAEHWRALCTLFRKVYGLNVDAATKNINRLRFMSNDPKAHFNRNAKVFTSREGDEPTDTMQRTPAPYAPTPYYQTDNTADNVERLVREIEARHIDITANYEEWLKACAALAHYFGEGGRDIFHRIARQSSKYRYKENEKLYSNILRSNGARNANIGSFFYLCKCCGLNVKVQNYHTPPRPQPRPRPADPAPIGADNDPEPTPRSSQEPPALSPSEMRQMIINAPTINKGVQHFQEVRRKNPNFDALCSKFDLTLSSSGAVSLTTAQSEYLDTLLTTQQGAPPF